jgi:hypothetical protein
MKPFYKLILIACLALAGSARAQDLSQIQKQAPFFAAALSQLLSDSRPFVAGAQLQLPSGDGDSPLTLPFGVAMLDGKMRWELDLSRIKNSQLDGAAMDLVKQMKLDRAAAIIEPEKNLLVVFPGLQAYLEVAMPKPEGVQTKAQDKIERLEKRLIGREVVDGYECLKYQLTVNNGKEKETAFVWQATKLKDFPIKLNVHFEKGVYGLHFSNICMGNPDARYFAIPAGYTRYTSGEALMQSVMAKSLGGMDLNKLGNLDSILGTAP